MTQKKVRVILSKWGYRDCGPLHRGSSIYTPVSLLFGQHLLSICFPICEHESLLYILDHKGSKNGAEIYVIK